MAQQLPIIRIEECLQLQDFGIDVKTDLKTTINTNRFICVNKKDEAIIIDLHDPTIISRFPLTDTSTAILNPILKTIAIIDNQDNVTNLRIFNIETKIKINERKINGRVIFFQWIQNNTLALIAKNNVYHWSDLKEDRRLLKKFNRKAHGHKIIDYFTDVHDRWSLLATMSEEGDTKIRTMQLHDNENGIDQLISDVRTACFIDFKTENSEAPLTLLAYCDSSIDAKLHIKELGNRFESQAMVKNIRILANDVPISMHAYDKIGLIYVITKFGWLFLYDVETRLCIFVYLISDEEILTTDKCDQKGGLICVNKTGKVISITINENNLVLRAMETLQLVDLASKLAKRFADNASNEEIQSNEATATAANDQRPTTSKASASNNGLLCIVCEEAQKCVMVEPCRHISMCRPCANQVFERQKQCPICRGRIRSLEDVYLS